MLDIDLDVGYKFETRKLKLTIMELVTKHGEDNIEEIQKELVEIYNGDGGGEMYEITRYNFKQSLKEIEDRRT